MSATNKFEVYSNQLERAFLILDREGAIFIANKEGGKAVNGNTESVPSIPEIGAIEKEKTITVLVAEDEEANFLYLEALLESLFKSITVLLIHVENGQEAIDICREQPIDLVLMDIKMPVMNGYTATKQIRTFKPGLPVIAQTAYALKSEMKEYSDVFDAYITKPFSMEKLRQVFSQFVKITE